MIICSCSQVTDRHIETALIEILSQPDALMPTLGVERPDVAILPR